MGYYSGYGGGICCFYANPTIKGNIIQGNYSTTMGGGIYCRQSSPLIRGNTILENECTDLQGGGICCRDASPAIENNFLLRNAAGYSGGGICSRDDSSPVIRNNMIAWNSVENYGGGIDLSSFTSSITNNTIFGNMAGQEGGGVYLTFECLVEIKNSMAWNNDAPMGSQICVGGSLAYPSTLTIIHSDVEGGQALVHVDEGCTLNWGAGMIDADPLLVDPLNDDFHLSFPSPCIDSGDNHSLFLPARDFEGDRRIFPGNGKGMYLVGSSPPGAVVDIGADEYCLLKRRKFIPK